MQPRDIEGGITAQDVRAFLRYEPDTGKFFRLQSNNQWKVGSEAGYLAPTGYKRIKVCGGRTVMAHRLAWLYMTGSWPKERIDHRDMNRSNNRWDNIREATPSQNSANKRNWPGRELPKGVEFHMSGKYRPRLMKHGKRYYFGLFNTPEEAHSAYVEKAKEIHGEFARAQ